MTRSKELAQNTLLLCAASLLAVLLAEGALRLGGYRATHSAWSSVPSLEARTADLGAPAPGRTRILALGDSFTEFADAENGNWVRVVEGLARRDGREVEAINLGQMGTGLSHYEKNLREYAPGLRPDLVLVGLYLGNDVFAFEMEAAKARVGLPPDRIQTRGRRPEGLLSRVRSRSVLLDALMQVGKELRARGGTTSTTFDANLEYAARAFGMEQPRLAAALAAADPELVRLARADRINGFDLAFGIVRPNRYEDAALLPPGSHAERAQAEFEKALLGFHQACRSQASHCFYVLLPAAPQVGERYFDYLRRCGYALSPGMVGDSPLSRRLARFLTDRGLAFYDPLPALAAEPEGTFIPMDTHLNILGQQVVGRGLYERLAADGLLEASPAAASR